MSGLPSPYALFEEMAEAISRSGPCRSCDSAVALGHVSRRSCPDGARNPSTWCRQRRPVRAGSSNISGRRGPEAASQVPPRSSELDRALPPGSGMASRSDRRSRPSAGRRGGRRCRPDSEDRGARRPAPDARGCDRPGPSVPSGSRPGDDRHRSDQASETGPSAATPRRSGPARRAAAQSAPVRGVAFPARGVPPPAADPEAGGTPTTTLAAVALPAASRARTSIVCGPGGTERASQRPA